MTDYFVRTTGNDTTGNGLSAATAWKTLGKALSGGAGPTGGDTVWVGAGVYREQSTFNLTSPTSELTIRGDITGMKTGDAGEVIFTAWLTDDVTAPVGSALFSATSKNWLTFRDLTIHIATAAAFSATTVHHWRFSDCTFVYVGVGGQAMLLISTLADTAANVVIERCIFLQIYGAQPPIGLTLARCNTADLDNQIVIRECLFVGGNNILSVGASGALSFKSGGVVMTGCTIFATGSQVAAVTNGNVSSNYPALVINCLILSNVNTETEQNPGQIISENNRIASTSGMTSNPLHNRSGMATFPVYLEVGQSVRLGDSPRPILGPARALAFLTTALAAIACQRGSTVTEDATVGTATWTNPGNAGLANDGNSATSSALPATTGQSRYLKALGGMVVPSGATIRSVRADVSAGVNVGSVRMGNIKLVKAGTISGNDLASSNTSNFGGGQNRKVFGSTADPLWGLTLTDTDVNDANFGVVVSFLNTSGSTPVVTCEYIRLIVVYELAGDVQIGTVDLLNRPRPSGGGATYGNVGALERHDLMRQESSVVDDGTHSGRITGPGDQEFAIPVDATATTITVRARYDATHGTGTKPTAAILDAPEIGVSAATATMTAAADTWETLTLGPFTPTAKGIVVLRLRSRAAAAAGIAYFDKIEVS